MLKRISENFSTGKEIIFPIEKLSKGLVANLSKHVCIH